MAGSSQCRFYRYDPTQVSRTTLIINTGPYFSYCTPKDLSKAPGCIIEARDLMESHVCKYSDEPVAQIKQIIALAWSKTGSRKVRLPRHIILRSAYTFTRNLGCLPGRTLSMCCALGPTWTLTLNSNRSRTQERIRSNPIQKILSSRLQKLRSYASIWSMGMC